MFVQDYSQSIENMTFENNIWTTFVFFISTNICKWHHTFRYNSYVWCSFSNVTELKTDVSQ